MNYEVIRAADRKAVRRAVDVDCQVVTDDDAFVLVGRQALDLSENGMLVRLERGVRVGDAVIVSLHAPRSRLYFDCEALVQRIEWGTREGDLGICAGLRFTRFDVCERAVFRAQLERLPPRPPRRHLRADYLASVLSIGA